MKIYMLRHGETDWNIVHKMQGRSDIELNEKGRAEARECRDLIKNKHFDKIYASPLKRAYETAAIVKGDRDLDIIVDERLIEVCFGDLEGIELEELKRNNMAKVMELFFHDPQNYVPVGDGETIEEACERTDSFLKDLKEKENENAEILIVAHGAIIKAMQLHPLGRDMKEFWGSGVQKNCSITVMEEKNGQYSLLSEAKPLEESY